MKKIFYVLFILFPVLLGAQTIVKNASLTYVAGTPGHTPDATRASEYCIDTTTMKLYWRNRATSSWVLLGQGIDVISGGSAPLYTPTKNQSVFAISTISGGDSLYYYRSGVWRHMNAGSLNITRTDTAATSVVIQADGEIVRAAIRQHEVRTRNEIVASASHAAIGDRIKVVDSGAEYFVTSDTITNYATDGYGIIQLGTSKYAKLRSIAGYVFAEWFGAVPDDGADDTPAFQRAVNFAIYSRICNTVKIGPGNFRVTGVNVVKDANSDGVFEFLTIHIEGANPAYAQSVNTPTSVTVTDANGFGFAFQYYRQCSIRNIFFQGQYVAPATTKLLIEQSEAQYTATMGCRNNAYSPHCAIVTDPYHINVTSGNRYPSHTGKYTHNLGGGGSILDISGCAFYNFAVGLMVSPNGTSQNSDNVSMRQCSGGSCKIIWASGQTQSRNNLLTDSYFLGNIQCLVNCIDYGSGIGTSPHLKNLNIAGGTKYLVRQSGGFGKVETSDIYAESLWAIGEAGTLGAAFFNSRFRFLPGQDFGGFYPSMHLVSIGPVLFEGGSLEYFANGTIRYPFSAKGSTVVFKGVHFECGIPLPTAASGSSTMYDVQGCSFAGYGVSVPRSLQGQAHVNYNGVVLVQNAEYVSTEGIRIKSRAPAQFDLFFVQAATARKRNGTGGNYDVAFTIDRNQWAVGDVVLSDKSANTDSVNNTSTFAPIGYVHSMSNDTIFCRTNYSIMDGTSYSLYLSRLPRIRMRCWGDITSGNTTISNVFRERSASPFAAGDVIKGTGIPVGARVVSANYTTGTIVISKAPTATSSAALLYDADYVQIFEKRKAKTAGSASAGFVTSGSGWAKGDILVNDLSADTTVSEWVCSKQGVFGAGGGNDPYFNPVSLKALSAGGAAGGDLSGTYPNPTIAAGAVTAAKLASMGAWNGALLRYLAGAWTPDSLRNIYTKDGSIEGPERNVYLADDGSQILRIGRFPNTGDIFEPEAFGLFVQKDYVGFVNNSGEAMRYWYADASGTELAAYTHYTGPGAAFSSLYAGASIKNPRLFFSSGMPLSGGGSLTTKYSSYPVGIYRYRIDETGVYNSSGVFSTGVQLISYCDSLSADPVFKTTVQYNYETPTARRGLIFHAGKNLYGTSADTSIWIGQDIGQSFSSFLKMKLSATAANRRVSIYGLYDMPNATPGGGNQIIVWNSGTPSFQSYGGNVSAGEGITISSGVVGLEQSATAAANPAMSVNKAKFSSTGLIFEGPTADNFETEIDAAVGQTADRTISFPDKSGVVVASAAGLVTNSEIADNTISVAKLTTAIASGTWTPTETHSGSTATISSVTVRQGHYIRVGSEVHFTCSLTVTSTATGSVVVDLSPPVSSNFTAATDCNGTAVRGKATTTAFAQPYMDANSTDDKIRITYQVGSGTEDTDVEVSGMFTVK